MMGVLKLETKEKEFYTDVETPMDAFKEFFERVEDGDIQLDDVGQIVTLVHPEDEMENRPLRTVPILYKIGVLDQEEAMANLSMVSSDLTVEDLENLAEEDYETVFKETS